MAKTGVLLALFTLQILCGVKAQIQAPKVPLDYNYDYVVDSAPIPADAGPALKDNAIKARIGEFTCPEINGDFEDPVQCDKYWRCKFGVAYAQLCEDGLVFDESKAKQGREDPCESPYVINCADKKILQEPSFHSEFCLRKNGHFADPDPTVCDVYYICHKGVHARHICSPTLHFNEGTGVCTWPVDAERTGCVGPKRITLNGFTCPDEEVLSPDGQENPHPSYPNLDDCQKFFTCLNGVTPQNAACNLGQVFNEKSMLCDYPENVAECDGWYRNDPRFADYYEEIPQVNSLNDPGNQDTPQ